MKLFLQVFAALAIAAAIFLAGHTVAAGDRGALVDFLREQNEKLKTDLERYLTELATVSANIVLSRDTVTAGETTEDSNRVAVAEPRSETVRLTPGNTAIVFDGAVQISLIGINFSGSPLSYRVTATVGGAGDSSVTMANAAVGHRLTYGPFEVLVYRTDRTRASFRVTIIKKKNGPA